MVHYTLAWLLPAMVGKHLSLSAPRSIRDLRPPMKNYKKIIINVVSVLVLIGIFYFLGRELGDNWKEIQNYPFRFDVPLVAFASLVYTGSFLVLAVGWYLLLKYFHHPLPFKE